MKTPSTTTFGSISILSLLALSVLVFAAPTVAATPTGCGADLTSSTTLTANVGPCSSDAIVISASNVVLNCAGFTVTGTGSETGIQTTPGVTNAIIENCGVTNFVYGILLGSGSNDKLLNNTAYGNSEFGYFIVSNQSLIWNNMAKDNGHAGFAFFGCSSGTSCQGGASFGYDNQVVNDKAVSNGKGNGGSGFGFVGAFGDTLVNDKAVNNAGDGINLAYNGALNPSFDNTLSHNKAVHNGGYGIENSPVTSNIYLKNVCEANSLGGSNPAGIC